MIMPLPMASRPGKAKRASFWPPMLTSRLILKTRLASKARVTAMTAWLADIFSRFNKRKVESTLASASVRPEAMATM